MNKKSGKAILMNKKSVTAIFVAVVMLIIAFFAVKSATSTDKTEQIYGTWRNTGGENEFYEFSPNGAVILSNDKVNFSGKYTIDDEKIYVQLADKEAECTYYFEDGYLYIVNESGKKSQLERIDVGVINEVESPDYEDMEIIPEE